MMLDIPQPLADRLVEFARKRGYESPSEFVAELVGYELDESEDDRDEIDRLLLEGMESGPADPVTPDFWNQLRDQITRGEIPADRGVS